MTSLATVGGYLATWIARANQAWGSSRVWNSGTSFEAALATMTADRDTWVSNSNTWQTRANNAWGPSRAWNSGESWEAAYGRVLPPASPYVATATITGFQSSIPLAAPGTALPLSGQANSSAGSWSGNTFTVGKTGHYDLMGCIGRPSNDNDRGNQIAHLMWWSSRYGDAAEFVVSWQDNIGFGQQHAAYAEWDLVAGDTVQLRHWAPNIDNGVGMMTPRGIRIVFVPTAAYPA